jgi:hypothetical protein
VFRAKTRRGGRIVQRREFPSLWELHPQYLDDDGREGVQFVRGDLAADEDGVIAWLTRDGFYNEAPLEISTVWMRPSPEPKNGYGPDEWYDVVDDPTESVRYWRVAP